MVIHSVSQVQLMRERCMFRCIY